MTDKITFPIGFLALNAGFGLAQSSDAGRQLTVVASEVRAPAQRSAEAAKETKTPINESSSQVTAIHF